MGNAIRSSLGEDMGNAIRSSLGEDIYNTISIISISLSVEFLQWVVRSITERGLEQLFQTKRLHDEEARPQEENGEETSRFGAVKYRWMEKILKLLRWLHDKRPQGDMFKDTRSLCAFILLWVVISALIWGLEQVLQTKRLHDEEARPQGTSTWLDEEKKILNDRRLEFIQSVSEPNLDSLLDELFHMKVINDQEMESARGVTPRDKKARTIIDMVRRKNNDKCSKMIEILKNLGELP